MALQSGTRVGPYEILAPLGAGGMGQVYVARDTRLGRKVAIKALLRDSPVGRRSSDHVLWEARAAATLTHPNIAAIHDIIEVDGTPLIVMEFVRGESLDAYLRHERPSIDQVIDWGLEISSALAAAHAHGVIHCDIKPANIRLTPERTIKVLDFGVARIRSLATTTTGAAFRANDVTTTEVPRAGGTPQYMAPEQLLSQPVDPRTDVYALGVVLFELLCGRRPFEASDRLDLGLQVLSGRAPAVTDINPAVPRDMEEIVSRAMARQPADRYASATAVADALRAVRKRRLTTSRMSSRCSARLLTA